MNISNKIQTSDPLDPRLNQTDARYDANVVLEPNYRSTDPLRDSDSPRFVDDSRNDPRSADYDPIWAKDHPRPGSVPDVTLSAINKHKLDMKVLFESLSMDISRLHNEGAVSSDFKVLQLKVNAIRDAVNGLGQ